MTILTRVFDELMRAGWPAVEEVDVDGWVVRFSNGVTNRANSVLPFAAPADVGRTLATVEAMYAERGLPTVFQVGPSAQPAGLDDVLAVNGYELGSPTVIMTVDIDHTEVGRPENAAGGLEHVEDGAMAGTSDGAVAVCVEVAETPDQGWLDLWWAVDGRGDAGDLAVAEKILAGGPALYATIRDERGAAAVGRLALVGEWGGVYCLAVRSEEHTSELQSRP